MCVRVRETSCVLGWVYCSSCYCTDCLHSEILDGVFRKFKAATKAYFVYFIAVSLRWFGGFYWLVKVVMFINVKGPNSCFLSVLCKKLGTVHNHFSVGKLSHLMCKEGSLLQGTPGELPCAQCTAVQRHQLTSISHQPAHTAPARLSEPAPTSPSLAAPPAPRAAHSPAVSSAHSIFMPWYKLRYILRRYWQL